MNKIMGWNYRIMATKCEYTKEYYFDIHEVLYNKKNNPRSYTENAITVFGQKSKDIKWVLKQMKKATKKPILLTGNDFPKIYKK